MGSEKPESVSLDNDGAWELKPIKRIDLTVLVRCLTIIFDEDCTLALAGVEADDVREFLSIREPEHRLEVFGCAGGDKYLSISFFPPKFERKQHTRALHMRMSSENLTGLVELSEHHAAPEVCMHLFVYRDDKVLMDCWDAGCSTRPMIADSVSEDKVKAFCEQVGFRYQKYVVEE